MSASATTTPEGEREDDDLARMSFGDHLEELRRRLIRALGAVVLAALVVVPFKNEVTEVYTAPYEVMWIAAYEQFLDGLDQEVAAAKAAGTELHPDKQAIVAFHASRRQAILDGTYPQDLYPLIYSQGNFRLPRTLKALGGLEDFWVFMGAVILASLLLAAPVVLYQAWAFIAAGLYRAERKAILRYFPFAVLLLVCGASFGYFVVVPAGLFFLIQLMNWARVESMMSVALYFSFLLTLTAALGVIFQLPLVMLGLQKVGLVSHEAMKKNWRHVVLGMFIVSAMLTPPDPFTQILMAVPMTSLYLIGLLLTARSARAAEALA